VLRALPFEQVMLQNMQPSYNVRAIMKAANDGAPCHCENTMFNLIPFCLLLSKGENEAIDILTRMHLM
jgi:hypothetical protein